MKLYELWNDLNPGDKIVDDIGKIYRRWGCGLIEECNGELISSFNCIFWMEVEFKRYIEPIKPCPFCGVLPSDFGYLNHLEWCFLYNKIGRIYSAENWNRRVEK